MFRLRLLKALWRSASIGDRLASIVAIVYVLAKLALAFTTASPPTAISTGMSILGPLFWIAVVYLVLRSRRWLRARLLWSLRNRLFLVYVFIAVIPIALLLAMGGILFYMGDLEVAAHLLTDDVNTRMHQVASLSRQALDLIETGAVAKAATPEELDRDPAIMALTHSASKQLPGITIHFTRPESAPAGSADEDAGAEAAFGSSRLIVRGTQLFLESTAQGEIAPGRPVEALVQLPVTPQLLDGMAPELGPTSFLWAAPAPPGSPRQYQAEATPSNFTLRAAHAEHVSTSSRALPPRQNWLDFRVSGVTTFSAFVVNKPGSAPTPAAVYAAFTVRPSNLTARLRASLGEFSTPYVVILAITGTLFLVLGLLGLVAGVVLTRTITNTVNQLDEATHFVKARDFSHRIAILRRDQLGDLADSFNSMTASIEELLEQQRQRQRLENELAIAREVQTELFPRSLPVVPGLHLAAVCRAARIVSGDYYDCLQLDPNRAAMAVADISGKGISAALLMASLNAALRSLIVSDGLARLDTDDLTQRLNRHLLLNTSDDRYATFFFSIYDAPSRTLRYTNAGHLPPLFVSGDRVEKLDRGGPVIGLLDNCSYEQASIQVERGSLLVVYSDGITEPENEYGEEFGVERLIAEISRHRQATPEGLCNDIIEAVRTWCAPAEPFDDQTVLVARMD